jgi:hypothetical protein
MEEEYDRLAKEAANADELLILLGRAETERFVLRQGAPGDLRHRIENQVWENRLTGIEDLLRDASFEKALELCERLGNQDPVEAIGKRLNALWAKAVRLLRTYEQATALEAELESLRNATDGMTLEVLEKERQMLALLLDLEAILQDFRGRNPSQSAEAWRRRLRADLQEYMNLVRSQAVDWVHAKGSGPGDKLEATVFEAATLLSLLGPEVPEAESWRRGCRELLELWTWLSRWSFDTSDLPVPEALNRLQEIVQTNGLAPILAALRKKGLGDEASQEFAALKLAAETSVLAAWCHTFLNERRTEEEAWRALGEDLAAARELLAEHEGSKRYGAHFKAFEAVERACLLLGDELQPGILSDEALSTAVKRAAGTLGELEALRGIREAPYYRDVRDLVERLRAESVRRIETAETQLSGLLSRIAQTREDLATRISLEDEAREAIARLKHLDPDRAERFDRQLENALASLWNDPAKLLEESGRFAELQRRILETEAEGGDVNRLLGKYAEEPTWRGDVNTFRARRLNVCHQLRNKDGDPQQWRDTLLEMRLKYGNFPELEEALREVRRQIAAKAARTAFFERFGDQGVQWKSWQEDEAFIDSLDVKLLTEEQSLNIERMRKDIGRMRMLSRALSVDEMEQFLLTGGGPAVQWGEALAWAVSLRSNPIRRIDPRWVNRESLENLTSAMGKVVVRKGLEVRTIDSFQNLDKLTEKLGERPEISGDDGIEKETLW